MGWLLKRLGLTKTEC